MKYDQIQNFLIKSTKLKEIVFATRHKLDVFHYFVQCLKCHSNKELIMVGSTFPIFHFFICSYKMVHKNPLSAAAPAALSNFRQNLWVTTHLIMGFSSCDPLQSILLVWTATVVAVASWTHVHPNLKYNVFSRGSTILYSLSEKRAHLKYVFSDQARAP